MFLSAQQIEKLIFEKEIAIIPFDRKNLKGASYTFTLDKKCKVLKDNGEIDSRKDPEFEEMNLSGEGYELKPGQFAIFYTKEKVTLNNKYLCLLSTRATIAQMGLDVSQSSFFCEPDTDNQFALEISNHGATSVRLYPDIRIVKGIFAPVYNTR